MFGRRGLSPPHAEMDVIADPSSVAVSDAARGEVTRPDVVIRPLASLADYRACAALQLEIWGEPFDGAVSPSLMQVATYVGGLAVGAFDPVGDLVGFVFGLTGVEAGKTIHWSHVLGVRTSLRNAGIGRLLKEYQRAELARRDIGEMYWTFDPLIARNAHLNLNVLGARVVRYAPDMYGSSGSPLHHGLATDRLVVVCETTAPPRDPALIAATPIASDLPLLTPFPQNGDLRLRMDRDRPPQVGLEVPTDFPAVLVQAPERAASWHAVVRANFQWALANGYTAAAFRRDVTGTRSFYLLASRSRPS
jgi:predicted GNAT superfamily acetyltransferase